MIYRDDLERVYALLKSPKRWTQGYFARDKNSRICSPLSSKAARFCIEGAACKVFGVRAYTDGGYEARKGISRAIRKRHAYAFNDTHTHAEVLALLKSAIERAPVRP